jgi:hypothetical protein
MECAAFARTVLVSVGCVFSYARGCAPEVFTGRLNGTVPAFPTVSKLFTGAAVHLSREVPSTLVERRVCGESSSLGES